MEEILEYVIQLLTTNGTLTAIVPANQIFSGPVDIATEIQSELLLPQINIHIISENVRTVPLNTRDTVLQIDIWSRNSYLETVQISEQILSLLNYNSPVEGAAKIFWNRLGSTVDMYESDRRIFHRVLSFQFWSQKGSPIVS